MAKGKAPAFQFYPGDWMQDTRFLSLAAKGAWIDYLCAMWRAQTRGLLSLPWVGYSRLVGATVEQTKAVTAELVEMGICDAEIDEQPASPADVQRHTDGNLTLINRRMFREGKTRELANKRQQRYEERKKEDQGEETPDAKPDAKMTPPSSSSSSSSSSKEKISPEQQGSGPVVFTSFPLIDKTEFEVTNSNVNGWAKSYPTLGKAGVEQCLREAREWCISNPSKRKTRKGARKFITTWLGKANKEALEKRSQKSGSPDGGGFWSNEL